MDRTALSDDIRVSYDLEPDFTRAPIEIPDGVRDRIIKRMTFLYDRETAEHWYPELARILKVHHAHKPLDMLELEKDYDPTERFTQQDMVLITYGDLIEGEQHNPLASLAYFVVTKITDAQHEKWELREQYRAIDDDLLVLTAERAPL